MNSDTQYHIDVTQEEDLLFNDKLTESLNTNKKSYFNKHLFGKMFLVVLGAHVVIAAAIIIGTSSAKASDPKVDSTTPQPLTNNSTSKVESSVTATPEPTPTPSAVPVTPSPIVETLAVQSPIIEKQEKYTKHYTVKKGDTIYSISKKYRLNTDKLLKLNNIKDCNKITIGQTLKFM